MNSFDLGAYDLISFDAGGTLLRPYPSVGEIYSRVARGYGCTAHPETIEEKFRDSWHRRDVSQLISYSDEKVEKDWWKVLVREVFEHFDEIRDFEAFFDELYHVFAEPHCWQLFPETSAVLSALRKQGKRLCIISNWDSRLFKLCEGLEILEHFEFVLISAVFGASKPSKRIFEEALSRAGVPAGRAVHIGDSMEDDIRGAKAAGMDAVLIDRSRRHHAEPDPFSGTLIVHDLQELLK